MVIQNSVTMAEVLSLENFNDALFLAGKNGLNNKVNWIHPLEIWDDPNEWIDGGELIFCCALGVNDPKKLIPFFRQLLEKGIAGFCLQLNEYVDKVPQEMIDLAEEYHCPLIAFQHLVRFIDLSRDVIKIIIQYVNQSYFQEKQQLQENHWILDWLNGNLSEEQICKSLNITPFNLRKFHFFAVIVEYRKSKITSQWTEGNYLFVSKNLHQFFQENQFFFYPLFANGLLTGIVLDFGKTDSWKFRFNHVVQIINEDLKSQEATPNLILASGYRSNRTDDMTRSYQTALETMEICQRFHTGKYIYEDLNLYFLLSLAEDTNKMERMKNFVMDQISPILRYDRSHNGKLMKTLKVYYNCNGNKQRTAKELSITRQSLYYRLEQIEEILDTDPLSVEKRLTLEISFALYEYFLQIV